MFIFFCLNNDINVIWSFFCYSFCCNSDIIVYVIKIGFVLEFYDLFKKEK